MGFSKDVFAAKLRAKRSALHVSQAELADMAGVSKDLIAKYELGTYTPSGASVFKLCNALGCDPNDLMGWPETA